MEFPVSKNNLPLPSPITYSICFGQKEWMSPPNPFWTDGERLTQVISEVPGIQLGGYVEGHGKELFPSGERERDGGDCG